MSKRGHGLKTCPITGSLACRASALSIGSYGWLAEVPTRENRKALGPCRSILTWLLEERISGYDNNCILIIIVQEWKRGICDVIGVFIVAKLDILPDEFAYDPWDIEKIQ